MSCEMCGGRVKHRTDEEKKALTNRLCRIEGQLRGIRAMLEEDRYCPDILNQTAAASAALDAFERELLASHIRTCVAEDRRAGREETVGELIDTLRRMMK